MPFTNETLMACLICSQIKSFKDFIDQGCENCEDLLRMKNNPSKVVQCTSRIYLGGTQTNTPKRNWFCQFLGLTNYVQGLYASAAFGYLPPDVYNEMRCSKGRFMTKPVVENPEDENPEDKS